ncbi:hypothetical protein [Pseudomonas parafulva]|uniref:hypothetical protein n=1 Tax=Pseudomonas parafulva TaxID=157782 RepID=UPI0013C2F469|nr:hypothetical protein [Pseudomonas parafulva]
MKVICKIDGLYGIKDVGVIERLEKYINFPDGNFGLVLDREYSVYGIVLWENSPFAYVFLDEEDDYPTPVAMDFFEISDAALSKYWVLSYFPQKSESPSCLVFGEWAQDPSFYEKLIEGDAAAIDVFNRYRSLMDSE